MSISFNYKANETVEVWKGVFYSPDHDPELNREPGFVTQGGVVHPVNWMSLEKVTDNDLLDIGAVLTYADSEDTEKIDDFQSGGVPDLIRSNDDSVILEFSCNESNSSDLYKSDWREAEGENTMGFSLIYKIRAIYKNEYSDNLSIPIKITNKLPTCSPTVLFNDDDIGVGDEVAIDVGTDSFTIRLSNIDDPEVPNYLEDSILPGGSGVDPEVLRRLVMFRQRYGEGANQTIDSLDIVGFSLEATKSGTGGNFVLDLTYTLNTDVEVPAVNKVALILVDPLELHRPESDDKMVLYNLIPDIVTVTADASTPVVSFTAPDDFIMMKDERFDGFNPAIAIFENQPNDGEALIDIPMSISLPDGATKILIEPLIKPSGEENKWNDWSDPQDTFFIIHNDGIIDRFDSKWEITDNHGMHNIDIVFRILQKDYWNGDFNLSLNIESYKGQQLQGEAAYELPHDISIKPEYSEVRVIGEATVEPL